MLTKEYWIVTRLELKGREELQVSGWCDELKESMRAAKKQRSGQLWSRDTDKALLKYAFFTSRSCLINFLQCSPGQQELYVDYIVVVF